MLSVKVATGACARARQAGVARPPRDDEPLQGYLAHKKRPP
eukprot:CAMPEP_0180289876 /NCGR_PEP_ID=MMETSP0988-20121125/15037_1 /TAXON_ID=697907 /ORGANISM="non described non described, Strain CCMP2293" /LENGTH=40 /DNA_ID= /DNA_START= /DNA_END= /DNA_ORIENTATION=